MDATVAEPSSGETGTSVPQVRLRYWAAAKAAAGRSEDEVEAANVFDALAAAKDLHGDNPRFAQVLGVCSFLLGDKPLGNSSSDLASIGLVTGDVIEVLPPFAGG